MSGISRRLFGVMACAALGCLVSGALVRGDTPSTSTGTIMGTVTANGQPVEGAHVMLMPPHHRPEGTPPTTQPTPQDAPAGGTGGDQAGQGGAGQGGAGPGGAHHHRPKPIAETTTAADGTYSFTNVAPGEYGVAAMLKGTGMGHAPATVAAGATVTVNLVLEKRQKGGAGGGGQGQTPPPPAN